MPLHPATLQSITRIFDALDYAALGAIYCHEGGDAFWEERRGPCQELGIRLAEVLRGRLRPNGRSLYVGAGVAELPMLAMETMDLQRTVAGIRPGYTFDVAAQRSVPEALICFLDATDFEGAVRNAVSLGGDADTMACIAGAIAEAHWGVPDAIAAEARKRLPAELLAVLERFSAGFCR